jgi:hypothetical protein
VRRPPIIAWSDVRWILFVVAGIGFVYAVIAVIGLSGRIPWGKVVFGVAFAAVLALIAPELRCFSARLRRLAGPGSQ